MNKNEENSAKSSTWAEEQFRKEADELVKRLETDDRFDDFEPPEELFQKLVVEARDEGLLRRSCDNLLWIVWCEYEHTRRQELCYG